MANARARERSEAERAQGVRKCSDLPVVEASVLMFEGSWQKDCASGTAHKGFVKWDRVRALRHEGIVLDLLKWL